MARLFPGSARKRVLAILFAIPCLATLLMAFHVEEGWRGRRAWAAYQNAALQRGVKLTLAEFLPPPVPDPENFAALPIFQVSSGPLQNGQPASEIFALPSNHAARPGATDLLKARRIDLVAWRDFFVESQWLEAPGPDAARDLLHALDRFAPALRQIRDAGARPSSRFPLGWDERLHATPPHLKICQDATALLGLRMSAHLTLREPAAAYADFSDGLTLYRGLRNEPVLMSGLVRLAILNRLINGLWDGLAGQQWEEPQLRALQKDLNKLKLMEDYRFSIESERAGINSLLNALKQTGRHASFPWFPLPSAGLSLRPPFPPESPELANAYPGGWLLQNQLLINQRFDEMLSRIDPKTSIARLDSPQISDDSAWRRFYHAPARALLPSFEPVTAQYLATQSRVAQTQIACALERFRLAKNAYPLRLEALVPEFLHAIPLDVIDGAPMRYHRTANGSFELWSIAINHRDERATVDPEKNLRDQPDWVWRYPGAPEVALRKQPGSRTFLR